MPVNYVATCIVEFSRNVDLTRTTAHSFTIVNTQLTPVDMLGKALESFGYTAKAMPYDSVLYIRRSLSF